MNREVEIRNPDSGIQNVEFSALSQFERRGFLIINSAVEIGECDSLAAELTPIFEGRQKSTRSRVGGIRDLLRTCVKVKEFANSAKIISLLEKMVGSRPFPVRAIFFDKSAEANWLVPWHQDLAIAVAERHETLGFTGWSMKDGVLHVHPPREILDGMITLRLHLDDCNPDNGALKIVPGSHVLGKLGAAEIADCAKSNESVVCEVFKGGVLLMRPLLLHASLPAKKPLHRRVLHIEYATRALPGALKWFEN